MNVVVNAWGESGALNACAFLSAACLGLVDNNNKIIVRSICFNNETAENKRLEQLGEIYSYLCHSLYGIDSSIIVKSITVNSIINNVIARPSLVNLYDGNELNKKLLSLGCSDSDLTQNISNGMSGNTSLGEAYFSNPAVLEYLYSDEDTNALFVNGTIIINTGDLCSDSTAITFIPLENRMDVNINIYRYNVLNGPSIKKSDEIAIRNSSEFRPMVSSKVDVFDIPEVIANLYKSFNSASASERNRMYYDLINLEQDYAGINSDNNDHSRYDSKGYPEKFIESLRSMSGAVSATFINLKTDGSNLLDRDVIGKDILSNDTYSRINIVNLLSALSISEIISNREHYTNGGVYGFTGDSAESFNIFSLLDRNKIKISSKFIVSAILLHNTIYSNIPSDTQLYQTIKSIYDTNYQPVISVFSEIDACSELSDIYSSMASIHSVKDVSLETKLKNTAMFFNRNANKNQLSSRIQHFLQNINFSGNDADSIVQSAAEYAANFVNEVIEW